MGDHYPHPAVLRTFVPSHPPAPTLPLLQRLPPPPLSLRRVHRQAGRGAWLALRWFRRYWWQSLLCVALTCAVEWLFGGSLWLQISAGLTCVAGLAWWEWSTRGYKTGPGLQHHWWEAVGGSLPFVPALLFFALLGWEGWSGLLVRFGLLLLALRVWSCGSDEQHREWCQTYVRGVRLLAERLRAIWYPLLYLVLLLIPGTLWAAWWGWHPFALVTGVLLTAYLAGLGAEHLKDHRDEVHRALPWVVLPLVALGAVSAVRWWYLRTPAPADLVIHTWQAKPDPVRVAAFSPDGLYAYLALGNDMWWVDLRDFPSVGKMGKDTEEVICLEVSPDGRTVLFRGGSLILADGTLVLPGHQGSWCRVLLGGNEPRDWQLLSGIRCAALSADDRWLVTGGTDGAVRLWDVQTGRQEATLLAHSWEVSCVAFAASGRWAVSGGRDGRVLLWDLGTRSLARELQGGSAGAVSAVAFSPDGRRVLAGCGSGVLLWDLESDRSPYYFDQHQSSTENAIQAIVVAADGRRVLSTDRTGGVILWRLPR